MCRLLGIYGQIDFWQDIVMEFRKQAEFGKIPPIENLKIGHKDGWGMATSNRDTTAMIEVKRQLGSAYESTTYREVVYSFKTTPRVFLCHLRQASENIPIALSNVHPFFVNEWAFIHNGTIFAMCNGVGPRHLINMFEYLVEMRPDYWPISSFL